MIAENFFLQPVTVEDAIHLALQYKDNFSFIAGGTDVMPNKFQDNKTTPCLIDITKINELKYISYKKEYLQIGALVTLAELENYPEIKKECPVLLEASRSVGSPIIRKSATLGGNLLCENRCVFYNQSEFWREAAGYCLKCNGDICIATGGKKSCFSKFVSDTAPALISVDAQIEITDNEGHKIIPLESIYSGNGVNPLNLPNTSLIKNILIPLNRNYRTSFYKLRQRESLEFTSLTTAVSVNKNGIIKIVMGGVSPMPVIITGNTSQNNDELIKQALLKSKTVNNDMFSRQYRREMIKVFLIKSFEKLLSTIH